MRANTTAGKPKATPGPSFSKVPRISPAPTLPLAPQRAMYDGREGVTKRGAGAALMKRTPSVRTLAVTCTPFAAPIHQLGSAVLHHTTRAPNGRTSFAPVSQGAAERMSSYFRKPMGLSGYSKYLPFYGISSILSMFHALVTLPNTGKRALQDQGEPKRSTGEQ